MAKQEKKVSVRSYRTKDGKRVKPFNRRQKVLTGAAVGGSVLGLVAAVKNKNKIKNLIVNAKEKRVNTSVDKLDFSIPKDTVVPDKYTLNDAEAFKISAVEFDLIKGGRFSNFDSESSKIMKSYKENKIYTESFEKGVTGYFLTKFDSDNKNKKHLVNIFINTGEKDFAGREIPAIISMELRENVDPRGLDLPGIKSIIDSDKKLKELFRARKSRELTDEEVSYVTSVLKELPSTKDKSSSGLVSLR